MRLMRSLSWNFTTRVNWNSVVVITVAVYNYVSTSFYYISRVIRILFADQARQIGADRRPPMLVSVVIATALSVPPTLNRLNHPSPPLQLWVLLLPTSPPSPPGNIEGHFKHPMNEWWWERTSKALQDKVQIDKKGWAKARRQMIFCSAFCVMMSCVGGLIVWNNCTICFYWWRTITLHRI